MVKDFYGCDIDPDRVYVYLTRHSQGYGWLPVYYHGRTTVDGVYRKFGTPVTRAKTEEGRKRQLAHWQRKYLNQTYRWGKPNRPRTYPTGIEVKYGSEILEGAIPFYP